jgi:hypothetical protein
VNGLGLPKITTIQFFLKRRDDEECCLLISLVDLFVLKIKLSERERVLLLAADADSKDWKAGNLARHTRYISHHGINPLSHT